METVGKLALAALTALMTMIFAGASPAIAGTTSLCTVEENPCAGKNIVKHGHETSVGKATLNSELPTIECNVLLLITATVEPSLAAPLLLQTTESYSGCNNFCSVKEENGPSINEVLKTGAELASAVVEGLVRVVCPFINCSFNGEGIEGHGLGPLASAQGSGSLVITEQEVSKESGGEICPPEGFLSVTSTPLSKTYISS